MLCYRCILVSEASFSSDLAEANGAGAGGEPVLGERAPKVAAGTRRKLPDHRLLAVIMFVAN
jgi:hypothetical protein